MLNEQELIGGDVAKTFRPFHYDVISCIYVYIVLIPAAVALV
jgi:hypothetical protein